jgi:hypothetical protein
MIHVAAQHFFSATACCRFGALHHSEKTRISHDGVANDARFPVFDGFRQARRPSFVTGFALAATTAL